MLTRRALSGALVAALALAGCGSAIPAANSGAGTLTVVAGFYPLQYLAERIGGSRVHASSLTKPGGEPHDLELSPRDVAAIEGAGLVVYLQGFQPAVDDAVRTNPPRATFDAALAARLTLKSTPLEQRAGQPGRAGTGGAVDPHFWLDPQRLGSVAAALTERMARAAPQDGAVFRTNLAILQRDLDALDAELAAGLANCTNRSLVTSHLAFGYLAARYGLQQVGISGLSPQTEPDPRRLADVTRYVRANRVRTIYYETLVDPAVAQTVARETGARTAVLDPLEGLTSASKGRDYLQVMRSNLVTLQQGQPCR